MLCFLRTIAAVLLLIAATAAVEYRPRVHPGFSGFPSYERDPWQPEPGFKGPYKSYARDPYNNPFNQGGRR